MKAVKRGSLQPLLALFIILLASSIFLLFKTYRYNIHFTGQTNTFLFLTTILFGLLLGVLYLANKDA